MTEDTYRDKLNSLQVEIEELRAKLAAYQSTIGQLNDTAQSTKEGDTISRQAAIDALWKAQNQYDGDYDDRSSYGVLSCVENNLRQIPPAQPDWNEIMVICDNCGHAIHAKIEDCEATEKQVMEYCKKRNLVLITMESFETLKAYYDWRNK